jgi:adenine-specific DNA-methyltransferase
VAARPSRATSALTLGSAAGALGAGDGALRAGEVPSGTRVESVGDPESPNRLMVGDNAAVLAALEPAYRGLFRCIYLDPPFNTGRTFEQYSDARTPSAWLAMMRERLELLVPLLADDGAIFAEIDDTELGALLGLMDDVMGRAQRVSIVTIIRSASTGHKAKNRGPVNVTDYLLAYEKSRGAWRCRPQVRTRDGVDPAYRTFLANPEASMKAWRFEPLMKAALRVAGYGGAKEALRAKGAVGWKAEVARFALEHADHVVRFAQPRFEAVSREAQALIVRSRREPDRIFRLERPGHPDLVLKGGNRLLFLSRKVRPSPDGPVVVEPLTNVWDDLPFQGIAKEGGVVFSRNKKPERLLARLIAMSTDEGDWVLDPFLGSGTTAAVAHKMGRRWVGIENGDQAYRLCLPRLSRVVEGSDTTGVSRAMGWRGGGGFGVYA